jgi:hypothetical protein
MKNNKYVLWKKFIHQMIFKEIHYKKNKQNLKLISQHPYLSLKLVQKYPYLKWDIKSLQKHPDMTLSFYKKHFHVPYQYVSKKKTYIYFQGNLKYNFKKWELRPYKQVILSYHPNIPLSLILKYHTFGWDFTFLLLYRRWTIRQIYQLMKIKKMNWHLFSKNIFLNINILHEFLSFPWDWNFLAIHPSFPPQDIYNDKILFCKWKWKMIFKNPRLCPIFWKYYVEKYPNACKDQSLLFYNHFQYTFFLKIWALFKIQHFFIHHFFMIQKMKLNLKYIQFIQQKLNKDVFQYILLYI